MIHDTILIYEDPESGCFVAHSLKTDQIGTGDDVVGALADVLEAVHQVMEAAREDETICVCRDAPPEVQAMVDSSVPLPHELYEIAHKRIHGGWPEDLIGGFKTENRRRIFRTEVHEVC